MCVWEECLDNKYLHVASFRYVIKNVKENVEYMFYCATIIIIFMRNNPFLSDSFYNN